MPTSSNGLLHRTLDVLILKSLSDRPRHGYEIVPRPLDTPVPTTTLDRYVGDTSSRSQRGD